MTDHEQTRPNWRKSSHSTSGEHDTMCIEVAALNASAVAARDSKNPSGPVLRFTSAEWMAFLTRLRQGAAR